MSGFTVTQSPIASEDSILSCLAKYFPTTQAAVQLGRGDDCALFHGEHSLAISTDLFLENTHFRTLYFTPGDIGYKALAVNLSDLAACGVKPLAFTLCLGLPDSITMEWLDEFFAGMAKLAQKYNINLVGGDLSRAESIHVSITVFGETSPISCFLTRGGSMPGDTIFLVGNVGLAYVGLHVLEKYGRSAIQDWPAACAAHLHPKPYCNAGLVLARAAFNARPPALMDVSDGLLRDLPRLLGINGELGTSFTKDALGAKLTLADETVHPEILRYANEHHISPFSIMMMGGEDYALLGACAPDLVPTLESAIPEMRTIGTITEKTTLICNDIEFSTIEGFDHFSRPKSIPSKTPQAGETPPS
ncbi:MAG: thiamine-phosphate kinase [Desulfovibrionaceae bacterium]|nr:thiamine-phosphate kinase [Desulfovibrionaceae bacterium]